MAAGFGALAAAQPAMAAYGDAANVFGRPTNVSGGGGVEVCREEG